MDKNEFMEGIHILQDNYHQKFTVSQLRLFYDELKDMPKDRYLSNIKDFIKKNSYLPTISQIRNATPKQYCNYEQRDYSNFDFNQFYAN